MLALREGSIFWFGLAVRNLVENGEKLISVAAPRSDLDPLPGRYLLDES